MDNENITKINNSIVLLTEVYDSLKDNTSKGQLFNIIDYLADIKKTGFKEPANNIEAKEIAIIKEPLANTENEIIKNNLIDLIIEAIDNYFIMNAKDINFILFAPVKETKELKTDKLKEFKELKNYLINLLNFKYYIFKNTDLNLTFNYILKLYISLENNHKDLKDKDFNKMLNELYAVYNTFKEIDYNKENNLYLKYLGIKNS